MKKVLVILFLVFINFINAQNKFTILEINAQLSAFGVESDDFPSIDAKIDFTNNSSSCLKSYYNPDKKSSIYKLTKNELKSIKEFLNEFDFEKIKKSYRSNLSDQPQSTLTIISTDKTITIYDYGLIGDYPLQEIYKY